MRACVRACMGACVCGDKKGWETVPNRPGDFVGVPRSHPPGRALCFMGRGALSRRPRLLGQEQGGLVRHAAHPRRPLGDGEVGGQVHLRGAVTIKKVLAP